MRALVLWLALLAAGCGTIASWTHPDHIACPKGIGKPEEPNVFVKFGNAQQLCANAAGTAEVTIFVTLISLPPQEVRVVINETRELRLYGNNITVFLAKAGLGYHRVDVYVGSYESHKSFSVWECQPRGSDQ